jgi:hypothetical protein
VENQLRVPGLAALLLLAMGSNICFAKPYKPLQTIGLNNECEHIFERSWNNLPANFKGCITNLKTSIVVTKKSFKEMQDLTGNSNYGALVSVVKDKVIKTMADYCPRGEDFTQLIAEAIYNVNEKSYPDTMDAWRRKAGNAIKSWASNAKRENVFAFYDADYIYACENDYSKKCDNINPGAFKKIFARAAEIQGRIAAGIDNQKPSKVEQDILNLNKELSCPAASVTSSKPDDSAPKEHAPVQ